MGKKFYKYCIKWMSLLGVVLAICLILTRSITASIYTNDLKIKENLENMLLVYNFITGLS